MLLSVKFGFGALRYPEPPGSREASSFEILPRLLDISEISENRPRLSRRANFTLRVPKGLGLDQNQVKKKIDTKFASDGSQSSAHRRHSGWKIFSLKGLTLGVF